MKWLEVKNNIITNVFEAEKDYALSLDTTKPYYDVAEIGDVYSPPSLEKDLLDAVIDQGIKLKKLEMGLNNNVV